jgi:hypothetical protein
MESPQSDLESLLPEDVSVLPPPSPWVLRRELEQAVVKELLGPAGGPDEEVDERKVRDRYLAGMLAPESQQLDLEEIDALEVAGDESSGRAPRRGSLQGFDTDTVHSGKMRAVLGLALAGLLALGFQPAPARAQLVPGRPDLLVNTATTGTQHTPSVMTDANGNFVVVWIDHLGLTPSFDIRAQRFDSVGGRLGSEFVVKQPALGLANTQVASGDAAGNFVVVWRYSAAGSNGAGFFAQRFNSVGQPRGTEFRVSAATTDALGTFDVQSDPNGGFVVVWEQGMPGFVKHTRGQLYASSGAPVGAAFEVLVELPRVGMDSAGDFVVAGRRKIAGFEERILAQRFASTGQPVGSEFQVSQGGGYTPSYDYNVDVSSAANGGFVVVWNRQKETEDRVSIWGRVYASDGSAIGSEFKINTYTTDVQVFPRVSSDSAGNFVVVWRSDYQDGDRQGVIGRRYNSLGVAQTPEFVVNATRVNSQDGGDVSVDPGGNFVVAFQGVVPEADGNIYAQGSAFPTPLPAPVLEPRPSVPMAAAVLAVLALAAALARGTLRPRRTRLEGKLCQGSAAIPTRSERSS